MGKVDELLNKYQDLFPMKFSDLKGIVGDLGVMNITFKPDAQPVKNCSYRLNLKYKKKFKDELNKMVAAGIIKPMEGSD